MTHAVVYSNKFYNILNPWYCGQKTLTKINQSLVYRKHRRKMNIQNNYYIKYLLRILKLPSLFAARLFWTFHNNLHNMKALIILSHHDHHFSHLLVFMKQMNFCGSLGALLEYFHEKKLPTAHCFNIGAHIGICAQISRNPLLYPPSLKRESLILLIMLISAWLPVWRAWIVMINF